MLPIQMHSDLQEAIRSDYPNYDDPQLTDISLFDPHDFYDGDTFSYDNSLSEPMLVSPNLGIAIQLGYLNALQHGGDPRFRLYPYSKADGLDAEQVLFATDSWMDVRQAVQKRGIFCHLDFTHLDNRTLESFRQAPKSFADDKAIGFTTIGSLACVVRKTYNKDAELSLGLTFVVPATTNDEKEKASYARNDILKACPAFQMPDSVFVTHSKLLAVGSDTLLGYIGEKIAEAILHTERYMDLAVYEPLQFVTNDIPMDPSYFALYEALETPCDFQMGDIDESLVHTLQTTTEQNVTRFAYLNRLRFEFNFTIDEDRSSLAHYSYLLRLFIKGEDDTMHLVFARMPEMYDYEEGTSIVEWAKRTMLSIVIWAVQNQYLPLCALNRDSTETLSFDWHQMTRRDFVHFLEVFGDADDIPEDEANHWIISCDGYPFLPYRTDDMESFYLSDAMQAKKSRSYPLKTVLAMPYEDFQAFVETALRECIESEAVEEEEEDEGVQEDSKAKASDGILPGLAYQIDDTEDALPYFCLGRADDETVTLYQPVKQEYRTMDARDLIGKDVPNAYPALKSEILAFVKTHLKKHALEQEQETLKMRLEAIEPELDALAIQEAEQAKGLHQKASFQLCEEEVQDAFQQSRLALPFHAMGKVKTTFFKDKLPYRLMLETKTVLSVHPEHSVFALLLKDTEQGEVIDTESDMYQETLDSFIQSSWMRPSSAELTIENGMLCLVRLYLIILPQYVPDCKVLIEHFNHLAADTQS